MKKIIYILTLVSAIAFISGNKSGGQKEPAEKYAKQAAQQETKGINKPALPESKADVESLTQKEPESRPGILFLLSNDKVRGSWSPALWWSYQSAKPGQPGC